MEEHIQMAPGESSSFVEMCGFGIESERQGTFLCRLPKASTAPTPSVLFDPRRGLGASYMNGGALVHGQHLWAFVLS